MASSPPDLWLISHSTARAISTARPTATEPYNYGTVFKLTPVSGSWTYTSLHDFTGGVDGAYPRCNIIFDKNGDMYGTAAAGGTMNYGVVFEITP